MTILTPALFSEYTTNYYLKKDNSYFTNTTNLTLQARISQVEISLNALLNGKLYLKYNPNDLQFHGTDTLTPELEQTTLYTCLTRCVEYNILTGGYFNLSNSYSGNINGNNNYSTSNSNVVGLVNDIRDMLYQLGIYQNVVIPSLTPKNILYSQDVEPINNEDLYLILRYISKSNITFTGNINFYSPDNILIANQPIVTYIQSYINFPYQTVLSNYLQNNQPIPFITNTDVFYWNSNVNSFSTILSNYSAAIPYLTQGDIDNWNSLVTEGNLSKLNQAVSTLQSEVATNTTSIATNTTNITTNTNAISSLNSVVNTHFEDTKNVMNILQNYEYRSGTGEYSVVPFISLGNIQQIQINQHNIQTLQTGATNLSNQIQTLSNMVNNVNNEYKNYSSILQNYLPNTPIPLITQAFMNSIANIKENVTDNTNAITELTTKIDNLEQNGISPELVQEIKTNTQNVAALKTVTNSNNQSIVSLKALVDTNTNNTQNLLDILSNYSNSKVPLITTTEVTNWNNLSQQVSTNTNNILSNTNQLNTISSAINIYSSQINLFTYILGNYYVQGGASSQIPMITNDMISQIYGNTQDISNNSNAIQQNQQNITTNTNDITNLQQSYTEEPTNSEWEWLNNNNSQVASQQWVTLTTKSGKTIYRLELKLSLRNTTEDRFNMSNTYYIAQDYSSTSCNWNIGGIIGGWFFAGNTYEIPLPNGVTVSKGINIVNYGKVYVNGGANTSFTSGTTTFINPNNIQSIWVVSNSIRFPQSMKNGIIFNLGWNEGDLVCINTLLYLDFSIE